MKKCLGRISGIKASSFSQASHNEVGDGHGGHGDEVLRGDFELQSAHARADVYVAELQAGLVDVGRKGLLHAHGRAAAPYVAGQRQQLFHRYQVAALVAGRLGGLLQVHLVTARNHAHEMSALVAFQHQGFENLMDILPQLVGDMLRAEVALVHLIGNQLIRHLLLVKKAAGIGLVDFRFWHNAGELGCKVRENIRFCTRN